MTDTVARVGAMDEPDTAAAMSEGAEASTVEVDITVEAGSMVGAPVSTAAEAVAFTEVGVVTADTANGL
jgi:hypothetical protein